jgi:hypothetical protein
MPACVFEAVRGRFFSGREDFSGAARLAGQKTGGKPLERSTTMSDQDDRPALNNEEPNEQGEDVEGHKKVYSPEEADVEGHKAAGKAAGRPVSNTDEGDDVEGHKFSNKATNKPAL